MNSVIVPLNIQTVLKNGPKNKTIQSFEREDCVESKYIIEN